MELRKDFTYSLVVPTSMGVRITPKDGQPVYSSDTFFMHATSAESNVAVFLHIWASCQGSHHFVKDSPIAAFIKNDLASGECSLVRVLQGGPGDIVTSSILPTAALVPEDRGFKMTEPERWEEL